MWHDYGTWCGYRNQRSWALGGVYWSGPGGGVALGGGEGAGLIAPRALPSFATV